MEIKYVDFAKCAKLKGGQDFKDNEGLFDREKDIIYVESGAGKHRRKRILRHEKAHRMLHKAGARGYFTDEQEEVFCDLWEIVKTPESYLTNFESHSKKKILNGYKWNNNKEKIIKAILLECGLKPIHALVCSLV